VCLEPVIKKSHKIKLYMLAFERKVFDLFGVLIIDCHFREATRELKCSDGANCMSYKNRTSTGDSIRFLIIIIRILDEIIN